MERREFLSKAGFGVVASALSATVAAADSQEKRTGIQEDDRAIKNSFSGGAFGLELDGKMVGYVRSPVFGLAQGTVNTNMLGGETIAKKSIADVSFAPTQFKFGAGMEREFYDWIQLFASRRGTRRNASLVAFTMDYREAYRVNLTNALITSLELDNVDAASKEAYGIKVTLLAEKALYQTGKRTVGRPAPAKAKQWTAGNYQVSIGNMPSIGRFVSSVAFPFVRCKAAVNSIDQTRINQLEPTRLEVGDYSLTCSLANGTELLDQHRKFLVDGARQDANEFLVKAELLDPTMKSVLMTIEMRKSGIKGLRIDPGGNETIARLNGDFYCEEVAITFGKDA